MAHLGITIFAGCVFLVAAFFAGLLPVSPQNVSRETPFPERYRETFTVKQGVSQDGQIAITKVPNIPTVPPRLKTMNDARTLRAFVASNKGGTLTLYVESVKPNEYYSLTGSFKLLPQYAALSWTSSSMLEFYGMSSGRELMQYEIDLNLLTFSEKTVTALPISTGTAPFSDRSL